MGSEFNLKKRPYDITMSKRTRKPSTVKHSDWDPAIGSPLSREIPLKTLPDWGEDQLSPAQVEELGKECLPTKVEQEEESDRKSLKQLIKGDEKAIGESGEDQSRGRSSLGQHFTQEEQHLQVVRKQPKEGVHGIKLRGMMSRYVKVLSHLIKFKKEPPISSRKKPVLRLTI